MPYQRWLKRNHANRFPARFVCLDTETYAPSLSCGVDSVYHEWRLGCASFDRVIKDHINPSPLAGFRQPADMWQWILGKTHNRQTLWVFAHNAIFDLTISRFWDLTTNGTIEIRRFVVTDPPTIIDCTYKGCHIKIVDTMNYCPQSLKSIGEMVGIEKMPMPHISEDDEYWDKYCQNDVAITRKLVYSLVATCVECDMGNFQATSAGLAMSSYRHRWMDKQIAIHTDGEVKKLERAAYYGGKVYCYRTGLIGDKVYHVDVNNLYPYIMANNLFPSSLVTTGDQLSPERYHDYCQKYGVIAQVKMEVDHASLPVRDGGHTIFQTGTVDTVIASPETQSQLGTRRIRSVGRYSVYRLDGIFVKWGEDWLRHLYRSKLCGNKLSYCVGKMIANALSGKWAQKRNKWIPADIKEPLKEWGEWWMVDSETLKVDHYRTICGVTQLEVDNNECDISFPAISAFVASYGRVYMETILSYLPDRSVYYMDTDSFLCSRQAVDELESRGLIHEFLPGSFKVDAEYSSVEILGLRRIKYNDVLSAPGIKPYAVEVADGTFLQDAWQGAAAILTKNPDGLVQVASRKVKLQSPRVGAYSNADGWTTCYDRPQTT